MKTWHTFQNTINILCRFGEPRDIASVYAALPGGLHDGKFSLATRAVPVTIKRL